jgi:hypothetical protein
MSTNICTIALEGEAGPIAARLAKDRRGTQVGWTLLDVDPPVHPSVLDGAVTENRHSGRHSLWAYTETSDYGCVTLADQGRITCRIMFDADGAANLATGRWILSQRSVVRAEDIDAVTVDALFSWCATARIQFDWASLREVVSAAKSYPEDGVSLLLAKFQLALPATARSIEYAGFEEAVWLWLDGRHGHKLPDKFSYVDRSKERFVLGQGADFYGIWDRRAKGPPIERFPLNSAGHASAEVEWLKRVTLRPL